MGLVNSFIHIQNSNLGGLEDQINNAKNEWIIKLHTITNLSISASASGVPKNGYARYPIEKINQYEPVAAWVTDITHAATPIIAYIWTDDIMLNYINFSSGTTTSCVVTVLYRLIS